MITSVYSSIISLLAFSSGSSPACRPDDCRLSVSFRDKYTTIFFIIKDFDEVFFEKILLLASLPPLLADKQHTPARQ